jgi:ribosome maturation factor RimP
MRAGGVPELLPRGPPGWTKAVYTGSGVKQSQWAQAHFFIGCMKTDVVNRINQVAERVAASEGIEIVDVQLLGSGSKRLLRLSIDKPGGVTHGDCENISQQVGTILDVEDIVPGGSYTLEVSSPGVERKLSKPADFERFVGQKVKVVLLEPAEGQKYWEGTLLSFQSGIVSLEPRPGEVISFPLEKLKKASIKFEW